MKKFVLLTTLLAGHALAAEPTAAPQPQPVTSAPATSPAAAVQDLQPAVSTSAMAPEPAAAVTAQPAPVPGNSRAAAPASGGRRAQDRLELDTTQITGNRELPKVLYIVPWKRSDLGDLTGRPVNSLLDEVLAPVDRDVFRRQNRYYDALHPDTGQSGSDAARQEVEK